MTPTYNIGDVVWQICLTRKETKEPRDRCTCGKVLSYLIQYVPDRWQVTGSHTIYRREIAEISPDADGESYVEYYSAAGDDPSKTRHSEDAWIYLSKDGLFPTKEEAQKECDRRNEALKNDPTGGE